MCQLLGMNCNTPTDIVFSFTGFATRGGGTDEHKDGWGIAFFEGAGVRLFVDHQSAIASPVAELIKHYPIKSTNVISHIRKATQGHVALENCHPFIRELWGRYWVFAHNGDLKEFSPKLNGAFRPVGTPDSERAVCFLLQELRSRFGDTPPAPSALNAHCSTRLHYIIRKYPFTQAKLSDEDLTVDFSEVTTPNDQVAIIVTEPLTTNETWHAFTAGEMKVFVDGKPVN